MDREFHSAIVEWDELSSSTRRGFSSQYSRRRAAVRAVGMKTRFLRRSEPVVQCGRRHCCMMRRHSFERKCRDVEALARRSSLERHRVPLQVRIRN